jgi:hypothetical protein
MPGMTDTHTDSFDYHLDLRFEREIRGISIETFSKHTKFSVKQLEKFEAGRYDSFPDKLVLRGLLKMYTQKLGLDPDFVMLEFHHICNRRDTLSKTILTAESTSDFVNNIQIPVIAAVVLASIFIVLVLRADLFKSDHLYDDPATVFQTVSSTEYCSVMTTFDNWFNQNISLDDDMLITGNEALILTEDTSDVKIAASLPTWIKIHKTDSGVDILKGLFPGETENLMIEEETIIWFENADNVSIGIPKQGRRTDNDELEMIRFIPE